MLSPVPTTPDLQRLRERLEPVLRAAPGVKLALLFGSLARGQENAASDLDVAVLDDGTPVDVPALAAQLSLAGGREVDVALLRDPGLPLLRELLRDSVVVYEREPGVAASFHTRALLAVETDGPWYDRMRDSALRRIAEGGFGGPR